MTHWRWEQRDETALLTLHAGNRRGALTVWSHHSCPAGRRGHGAVPGAEREQGEGREGRESRESSEGRESRGGREGSMSREGRESREGSMGSVGRQLPTHSQTAGNWGGWEGRNSVDGCGMAVYVCVCVYRMEIFRKQE